MRTKRWRPGLWLGTLSTVVAVATGMFTLRDQIFPQDAGTAAASVGAYEQSVGDICTALNKADAARTGNARKLKTRLARATTLSAQRNAVLDSWNQVVNGSQHELALFEGLDVPSALQARERATVGAWERIVASIRGFTQRLDAVSSRQSLLAAVNGLPAMGTLLAAEVVTRTAGLTELGGGRCVLDQPVAVATITLTGTKQSVTPPQTTSIKGSNKPSATAAVNAPQPSQVTPSVTPTTATPPPTKSGPLGPAVSPPETSPRPPGPSQLGKGS